MAETKKPVKTVAKHELASFGQRLLAGLIDMIILAVLGSMWRNMFGFRAYQMIGPFIGALYVILLWVNWNGQTLGKKLLGLKVLKEDNKPVDYQTAILRYIGYIISAIPLFLGYFWMLWDDKKQTWHDKIAKTKVVKE